MHGEIAILRELLLVAGVSLAVLLVFQRLRMPAVTGFIVAGVLIGPAGFGLVHEPQLVATLAEFGVMLLLFTVGLEFSLADLKRLRRAALAGGTWQAAVTIAAVTGALVAMGRNPAQAAFFGILVTLSSTATVLRLLADRLELASPHGRWSTGVLIAQDLLVVPFAIVVPWLASANGGAGAGGGPALLHSLMLLAMVAVAFAGARWLVPHMMRRASPGRSREAFVFGVVLVALGGATLTAWAGLSPALGAFIAGLMLASSDLRAQIAADVLPLRDLLASVFFVTIGMLLRRDILLAEPLLVLGGAVGMIALKLLATFVALRLAGASLRVSVASALTLAQVGEFSFVLAQTGVPGGLLPPLGGQVFYAAAVVSLLVTPLLIANAGEWAMRLDLALAGRLGRHPDDHPARGDDDAEGAAHSTLRSGHVVIAGFGLNGRNVARVLRAVHVPHLIVDLDADGLQLGQSEGSPVMVGDITQPFIQRHAGVTRARVMVLALSDPTATRHAVRIARGLAHDLFIIVRTRYVAEIDELYRLGANQVIPEEFETSIEIFTATLRHLHVPWNLIQAQVRLLREERYSLLRGRRLPSSVIEQLDALLEQGTTDNVLLLQHSPAIGHTLGSLGLASVPVTDDAADGAPAPPAVPAGKRLARVVAVVRGGRALTPSVDLVLAVGDTLVLVGTHAEMERALRRLDPAAVDAV